MPCGECWCGSTISYLPVTALALIGNILPDCLALFDRLRLTVDPKSQKLWVCIWVCRHTTWKSNKIVPFDGGQMSFEVNRRVDYENIVNTVCDKYCR